MEYDRPWGKLFEKQASYSKFALSRAPNRKTRWTKQDSDQDLRTQSRNSGGRADDLEFR